MVKGLAVFLVFSLALMACSPAEAMISGLPEKILPELAMKGSRQVLLVVNDKRRKVSAEVHVFEEEAPGKWKDAFVPIRATIGEAGFAPPGKKRTGDRRSPTGVYDLRRAFGYSPEETDIDYITVTKADVWVNDPKSHEYNTLVKRIETKASSFEEMKRDDGLYKYGIVIEYNTGPAVAGRGSAIFFHIWRGPGKGTLGCVAMSEENILKLIKWLDPLKNPKVVMGTRSDLIKLMKDMR